MKKVIIYTDGACSGNPGCGGYAAILKYKNIEKEIVGKFRTLSDEEKEKFIANLFSDKE